MSFSKDGLPSLAGLGPKYYIGPLEPNTPTKKIKNIYKLEILERLLS